MALVSTAASALMLVRAPRVKVIVDDEAIKLVGLLRTRSIPWSLVERLEMGAAFGGPALFVVTRTGERRMVPLMMARQRRAALDALRNDIIAAGPTM